MDISCYVNDEKSLICLLDLIDNQSIGCFFETEANVLSNLPHTRRTAVRLMEYVEETSSSAAWKILIVDYKAFLTEKEKHSIKQMALEIFGEDVVRQWESISISENNIL